MACRAGNAEFADGVALGHRAFAGTGTRISARLSRQHAVATDITPFLIWIGRVKAARTASRTKPIRLAATRSRRACSRVSQHAAERPPLQNANAGGRGELEFVTRPRRIARTRGARWVISSSAFCRRDRALERGFNPSTVVQDPRRAGRERREAHAALRQQFREDARPCGPSDNRAARYHQLVDRAAVGLEVAPGSLT